MVLVSSLGLTDALRRSPQLGRRLRQGRSRTAGVPARLTAQPGHGGRPVGTFTPGTTGSSSRDGCCVEWAIETFAAPGGSVSPNDQMGWSPFGAEIVTRMCGSPPGRAWRARRRAILPRAQTARTQPVDELIHRLLQRRVHLVEMSRAGDGVPGDVAAAVRRVVPEVRGDLLRRCGGVVVAGGQQGRRPWAVEARRGVVPGELGRHVG